MGAATVVVVVLVLVVLVVVVEVEGGAVEGGGSVVAGNVVVVVDEVATVAAADPVASGADSVVVVHAVTTTVSARVRSAAGGRCRCRSHNRRATGSVCQHRRVGAGRGQPMISNVAASSTPNAAPAASAADRRKASGEAMSPPRLSR